MSGYILAIENGYIIAIIAIIPSAVIGYLGYRRSVKVDKTAATAAFVAARGDEVTHIITGLNQLIDNLQADNLVWRETVATITVKLESVIAERDQLRLELARLNKMLDGANGPGRAR